MNCVIICCDTFRHDMLNHPTVKVPNIDRLMRDGVTFTNAFAEETKASIRNIPLDAPEENGSCILCGKPSRMRVPFAKAY